MGKTKKQAPPTAAGGGELTVVVNRKARHDYFIEDSFEAGLMLCGSEVKALRDGKGQLRDSYARIRDNELWLYSAHIDEYTPASRFGHDPRRTRKLLMHRREIDKLIGKMREKGLALIPLRIYFKRGRAKAELGLARGKKMYDKRATIKEQVVKREMDRAVRERNRRNA